MSCNIIREFITKDGKSGDLLAFLEKSVHESLHRDGCIRISIEQNQDNRNHIISNQYWETREHYEEYRAWRTSIGTTAQIQEFCAEPAIMTYFDEVFVAMPPDKITRIKSS